MYVTSWISKTPSRPNIAFNKFKTTINEKIIKFIYYSFKSKCCKNIFFQLKKIFVDPPPFIYLNELILFK